MFQFILVVQLLLLLCLRVYGYRFVNTKFTVFGWIPFWDVICLFAIYWEMFGVPAVAQYSVGWSVFHGAHTAVLGIGFFGNPFCHCPYAQSQRHQGTCATDRWGLPFPTDARISNVSPHMPL